MKNVKHVNVAGIDCGSDDLFLISGPCVIEEESMMMKTAERLKEIATELDLPLISSHRSPRTIAVHSIISRAPELTKDCEFWRK